MSKKIILILAATSLIHQTALADDNGKWNVKLYGGLSTLSNQQINQTNVASVGSTGNINNGNGFMAGGSAGFNFTNNLSVELAWDYRSNDSKTNFSDGSNFSDGNFASNIFFINSRYTFDSFSQTKLRPYVGAGLGYVEEIDIDLKSGGVERSYSKNNEIAYQFLAGASYPITEQIDLDAGLRYVLVDNIKLKSESGSGELSKVDYDPLSLVIGLSYKF
jgi:outer membrane protein W